MILEQSPRIIVGIFVVLLLLTSSLTAVITTTPATHSAFASSSTGIIVPVYSYPGSYWSQVIQAKNAHPSVPIIAIINPNSGPGTASDSNYVTGIKNLQAAGITVLGYVYTSYAARSISTAESDVSSYKNWYNVNGIMFDEMSNVAGNENYYSTLTQYVKSHGMTMTVGNPGTSTLASYVGTVDNITIYETGGMATASTLATGTFYPTYPSSDFSMISYGVSTLDTTAETKVSPYVGYLYITNDVLSNPYDTVPSYFSSEVGTLDAGITTTVSQPPTNLVATAASSQINLSWLAPSSNGGSSITGYKIERSVDGGATWSAIVLNSGSTATTDSDTGLQSSTTYTYRVSAINSVGTSNPSNTASATIAAILTAPTIALNPTSGSAGSSITVTGTNFASSSGITVSYDGSAVSTNPGTITTSSSGGFS